jgi:STE24 endopeptidase
MEVIIFRVIVLILILDYLLERFLEYLNAKNLNDHIPVNLKGIYDQEKYSRSQLYEKTNQKFSFFTSTFALIVVLILLFFNVFGHLDTYIHSLTKQPVLMALIFFGILGFAADILSIPFSVYRTFVIEERFGFNKTSPLTFLVDKLKGWSLGLIIGGGLLALVVWIYTIAGHYFWVVTWFAIAVFSLAMMMFYTTLIVPLFNKLSPLEPGDLREAIEEFAAKTGFSLSGILVMDGSKRSRKANAYFSGMGSRKRIILFDTLVKDHSKEELLAILAHEIGHYKKKHTLYGLLISNVETAIMLAVLGIFIGNPTLSLALGASEASFHMGLLAFAILYSPVSSILGLLTNWVSRKNEFQADRFAGEHYDPQALTTALKNLSVNHLSNLTPHPAYVFFYYSHPTLLQRMKALENLKPLP